MITDLLISAMLGVWNAITGLLPDGGSITIPGISTLNLWLARADSFLPIAGPLALMVGILSAVGVFITVRLIITAIQVVKP
jgi:hypothetical protein